MKRIVLCAIVAISIFACGEDEAQKNNDDPEGGLCETLELEPCGGDVSGTWTLETVCPSSIIVDEDPLFDDEPACTNASIAQSVHVLTSEAEFTGEGTYELASIGDLTLHVQIDAACVAAVTEGNDTLEQYCTGLEAELQSNYSTLTCHVMSELCECHYETSGLDFGNAGTYEVDGTSLVMTRTGGEAESSGFCVEDGKLFVEDESGDELVLVYSR